MHNISKTSTPNSDWRYSDREILPFGLFCYYPSLLILLFYAFLCCGLLFAIKFFSFFSVDFEFVWVARMCVCVCTATKLLSRAIVRKIFKYSFDREAASMPPTVFCIHSIYLSIVEDEWMSFGVSQKICIQFSMDFCCLFFLLFVWWFDGARPHKIFARLHCLSCAIDDA